MNIAFITKENLSYDEAPPSRILNIKGILDRYHEVTVISQKPSNVKEDNIYEVPKPVGGFLGNQIFKIFEFVAALHLMFAEKIDFFIVREYYFVLMLYPFTKLFRKKVLYEMHCFRYRELIVEGKKIKAFATKPFEILAHKLAYKLLVISDGIMHDLSPGLQKKSVMLPNGVDLEEFDSIKVDHSLIKKYHIPQNKPMAGFLGNWMEWVDVPTFLHASKFVKNATFIVIGEGFETESFTQLRQQYPNIIFTGRINHKDAIKLLKLMSVCVLPYKKAEVVKHLSIRKTFEYLAAGKPIVMSNSNISEKSFLRENVNMLLYEPENSNDLALKISNLLSDKKLMQRLAKNNQELSKSFGWEQIVMNSDLLRILHTYHLPANPILPKCKISIIIKAFNEEEHIGACINSALSAIKGIDGEVILVDSKSTDRTVEIAKKYPIRILQLKNGEERRCGMGPQTGYLFSKGNFIYILDGDMILDRNFIKKALPYFNYKEIAGVGGNITEMSRENLAFQVRSKYNSVNTTTEINQLGMGGLYRRKAIDDVGYFSNPYLFAYEEYDLGAELRNKGYKMIRIPEKMIKHFGDATTSFETLKSRWRSRYLFGSGQYLRTSIQNNHFFNAFNELKIYLLTLTWLIFGLLSLIVITWSYTFIILHFIITVLILALLLVRKKSLKKLIFSLFSWNLQSMGMILGFLFKYKSPLQYRPNIRVIK